MKLHDYPLSGNGYKVRLLLSHLGQPYEYVPVDILAGEARTDSFLKLNPLGKVPVLELDDGRTLPESNAILFLLSQGSSYWPVSTVEQADVLSWLFFEQRSLMPDLGGARYWLTIQKSEMTPFQRALVQKMQTNATVALRIVDQHLARKSFLAGPRYTIADIALYAYTHLAHEASIELAPYAGIGSSVSRSSPAMSASISGLPYNYRLQRTVARRRGASALFLYAFAPCSLCAARAAAELRRQAS